MRMIFISGATCLSLAFSIPAYSIAEPPRAPLCELNKAKLKEVTKLESGFRSGFCKDVKSDACGARWVNASSFLERALADPRVTDVGTISYMFGTIYAETENNNFSPSTIEKIGWQNKNKEYVTNGYFGRGWIQLTHKDKYKKAGEILKKDLLKNPDLALDVNNAYEILFSGMSEGWIEVYRTSANGAVAKMVPIKLGDFVSSEKVNYPLARAVINANCKKKMGNCSPPNIEYLKGLFIPPSESLDASNKAAAAANKMELVLCRAINDDDNR